MVAAMDQPGNHDRIDAITGLRGMAALLVVYGHSVEWFALPWKNHLSGELGVMIFFSLSGFLMAYLYLDKQFSIKTVTEYAIHRFSRIAPAYLVILLASFFIYTQLDPHFVYNISEQNILRHLLFSGNVSVFWSITPEVEFYFLFVLFWAAVSRYRSRRELLPLLLLVLCSLILLSYRASFPGTFLGSKLHYFLFGAGAGMLRSVIRSDRQRDRTSLSLLHAVLAVSTILILCGWLPLAFSSNNTFYDSVLSAVFGALIVFCLSFPSALGAIVFENKFILLCGECSFSIYLLHMPVIYLFRQWHPESLQSPLQLLLLAPFIALVLLFSWLSYRFVERPGARLIKSAGKTLQHKVLPFFALADDPPAVPTESEIR